MRRPFTGVLLRTLCSHCGRRLWGLLFDAAIEVNPDGTVNDMPATSVAICGHCDRPDSRSDMTMYPRTGIVREEVRVARVEPPDRGWFLLLLILAVAAGCVAIVAGVSRG